MKLFKRFKHSKSQLAFWLAMFVLLAPGAASAEGAIDPNAAISKVLTAIIGVGAGIATAYCVANALFLIIGYMSKKEAHDRAELKGKLQYLVILEMLALTISGIIYWIKGLLGY
ncbi:hypothetical protein SAMN04488168_12335 [Bacillus sp. 491mf]|uniref:TrbC/VirB2 family protein n=1 Tax=Bacillus sp. 491mf TaxID=1761755 RepID=UPI0008E73896|nr:TrbC/VirB2 family protein [Bacillus sp. 491mf]SFD18375.1 hypothetical protein SAMN04488168_12335 [Bacillus sp. 491mf]